MKKIVLLSATVLSATMLLTGCLDLTFHGGSKAAPPPPVQRATLGQQLIDLQKAKDNGAINDTEFQVQKARLLQDYK